MLGWQGHKKEREKEETQCPQISPVRHKYTVIAGVCVLAVVCMCTCVEARDQPWRWGLVLSSHLVCGIMR